MNSAEPSVSSALALDKVRITSKAEHVKVFSRAVNREERGQAPFPTMRFFKIGFVLTLKALQPDRQRTSVKVSP
jgi:hypothetical protein